MRHIVSKGSNQEIGKALGDIAQKWLNVKLSKFARPLYAEANNQYIQKNYPILWERLKGVAQSYGLPPGDKTYNTSPAGPSALVPSAMRWCRPRI